MPPRLLLPLALAASLQAATHNLLEPQWQASWMATTQIPQIQGKPIPGAKSLPIRLEFAKDTNWLTATRPGTLFNPGIIAAHFGKNGPLPPKAATPPETTLANIGDTLGVRMVVSYNAEACKGLVGNPARLAFANSGGTRQAWQFLDLKSPVFNDDTGWCLHFGQGAVNHFLYQRPLAEDGYQGNILTSIHGGKRVKDWPNPPPVGFLKPDVPFEMIFSLTRTGPDTLKIYAFIASHELEHNVSGVTGFTFDTVYFHFPNGKAADGASFTIREFQLNTP